MPDANRMAKIADWLGVKVSWLRDGEGEILKQQLVAEEPAAANVWGLTDDAIEIARVWMKMPPERQRCFRDLMCLEAVVATHYPWLTFGRPKSESYNEYERRVERDIMRIAAKLQMKS